MQSTPKAVEALVPALAFTAVIALLGACKDTPTRPASSIEKASARAAAAASSDVAFDGFICFGPGSPGSIGVTPGGTTHVRDFSNTNQWVTGNALIDGMEHNTVSANINRTGSGVAHLDVSLQPNGINGTWEIRQTLRIEGGVPTGSAGRGHGTGDLRGMTIQFTTGAAAPRTGCAAGFAPFGPTLHGVIHSGEHH